MIARIVDRIVTAQEGWAEPFGAAVQKLVKAVLHPVRPLKDFLHGTWLGHALHPALTDLPIGALLVALILDVLDLRQAADATTAAGVVAMLAAWVTGLADYTGVDYPARNRVYATVHGLLMTIALVLYAVSLAQRFAGPTGADRSFATALAVVGYAVILTSSYFGGHLVFALGTMVDRHAWREFGTEWRALDLAEVPQGQPTRAKAGGASLVVVRHGERVYALHDICAHAGCNLSEGKLVGKAIECGCHGSRFDLATGHVVGGPATSDQPRYEVRTANGRLEVRRASG